MMKLISLLLLFFLNVYCLSLFCSQKPFPPLRERDLGRVSWYRRHAILQCLIGTSCDPDDHYCYWMFLFCWIVSFDIFGFPLLDFPTCLFVIHHYSLSDKYAFSNDFERSYPITATTTATPSQSKKSESTAKKTEILLSSSLLETYIGRQFQGQRSCCWTSSLYHNDLTLSHYFCVQQWMHRLLEASD